MYASSTVVAAISNYVKIFCTITCLNYSILHCFEHSKLPVPLIRGATNGWVPQLRRCHLHNRCHSNKGGAFPIYKGTYVVAVLI